MKHSHGNNDLETKNISFAFFLNLAFTIIEIIGGIFTNSVAILSDAAHDLGDSISLGLSWYLQKVAKKDSDQNFTYGYRRYSVFGALVNLIILIIGSIIILYMTIPRFFEPQEVKSEGMLFLAILGILVNGFAMYKLNKGSSINEKVVSLHFLDDVLGWVAVLLGSIAMMIWDVPIIDPILSILIIIYMMYNIIKNFRLTLDVLLQRTPRNVNFEAVTHFLTSQKGIINCEDVHIWSLDGEFNIMTCNINFDENQSRNEMKSTLKSIHQELKKYNIHHATIETI